MEIIYAGSFGIFYRTCKKLLKLMVDKIMTLPNLSNFVTFFNYCLLFPVFGLINSSDK